MKCRDITFACPITDNGHRNYRVLRLPNSNIVAIWSSQIFLESVGHTESETMSQWPIIIYGKNWCEMS